MNIFEKFVKELSYSADKADSVEYLEVTKTILSKLL